MRGKNVRRLTKGTCACESSSKINNKALTNRKGNYTSSKANSFSNMHNRSIKSRFL